MSETPLFTLSPLDGRYRRALAPLRPVLSEFGLIARRVRVEIAWLLALSEAPDLPELPAFSETDRTFLESLAAEFCTTDAERVAAIEATTNHDVKAVEYWLKERMSERPSLAAAREFVHFACTSEDINNLAYALMLEDLRRDILGPALQALCQRLRASATDWSAQPMLARTHGQTASPTTVGKEFANVGARLERQLAQLQAFRPLAKLNGAVGNYNAHVIACPALDWPRLARSVVEGLGLSFNAMTTQIEPHDWIAELCDLSRRVAVILIDFCRDLWSYISLGYFRQKLKEGEVGSSTMPHKVNPIDFENAEGNLGLAVALFGHFSEKLPISRMQRDLTDSTVLRNLGVAFGHLQVALGALNRGLGKLELSEARLAADLAQSWEVLGEAVQTVMRRHGLPEPYEQLKALSRGRPMDADTLHTFIRGLPLPAADQARLLALTPADYIGLAERLARDY